MKKSELIERLNAIEGDFTVFFDDAEFGEVRIHGVQLLPAWQSRGPFVPESVPERIVLE